MIRRVKPTYLAAALLLAGGGRADAHIVGARLGDFYAGAMHPLTDLQDLILWGALALLGAAAGVQRGRWLVLMLPLGLLAGLAFGVSRGIGPLSPIIDAGMTLALGVLLAAGLRVGTVALCLIALGLAFMRGIANGSAVAPGTQLPLFAAGLACAGYAAIALLTAATVAFRGADDRPPAAWRDIAIRACGSWIAAIGVMMGAFVLAS
jgi:urease accessory protein